MSDIKDLNLDQCKDFLHGLFQVKNDGLQDEFYLTLEEVEQRAGYDPELSARVPFSMLFSGPLEPVLQQQVYRLDNGRAGSLEIFLVPLGPRGEHMHYEAVFT